jgi:hypothetical protein
MTRRTDPPAPSEKRTDDEADAEGGTDETEVLGAIFRLVTSAIEACATERFPPVMPSSARARNSSGMLLMTMPVAKSA